jgi:hypothetical protein
MPAAVASSQVQTMRMPPLHFSILILQRGTIAVFIIGPTAGIGIPMPAIVPGIPAVMGLIIVLTMIPISFILILLQDHPRSSADLRRCSDDPVTRPPVE